MLNGVQQRNTEVMARAKRRRFTADYKRKIVAEADACRNGGDVGALLRREGLYSSHLANWRAEGDTVGQRPLGRKRKVIDERDQQLKALQREIVKLRARAVKAELLVEIQKKVSMILGIDLPSTDEVD